MKSLILIPSISLIYLTGYLFVHSLFLNQFCFRKPQKCTEIALHLCYKENKRYVVSSQQAQFFQNPLCLL